MLARTGSVRRAKITLLLREHVDYLSGRCSERKEAAAKVVADTAGQATR
jgi:hypothetical protein